MMEDNSYNNSFASSHGKITELNENIESGSDSDDGF